MSLSYSLVIVLLYGSVATHGHSPSENICDFGACLASTALRRGPTVLLVSACQEQDLPYDVELHQLPAP
jgi:hypothetical protein